MNFKKFLASSAISGAVLLSLAVPAFAAPPGPYEQPGAAVAADHTVCSGAGAFGWFGTFGEVDNIHNVGDATYNGPASPGEGYDEYADGTDDNVGQGAEGGVT